MKAFCLSLVFVSLLGLTGVTHAKPVQVKSWQCSTEALEQAKKLLAFHTGDATKTAVDPQTKLLPPMPNPKNKKQKLEVIEAWGNVEKVRYRMHLIYNPQGSSCILMGQEILEFTKLK